jgi:hypothetical protein
MFSRDFSIYLFVILGFFKIYPRIPHDWSLKNACLEFGPKIILMSVSIVFSNPKRELNLSLKS